MEENYNKYQQERHQEQFQEYQKMNGQKKNSKKGWLWGCGGCLVLVILIIIGISACTASITTTNSNNSPNDTNATSQEKAALNKAKIYSDTMHMSKQGIYDQLTSDAGEKFKEKDANYAIEHLKANYKENAKKKAKDYVEQQNMSKDAEKGTIVSQPKDNLTLVDYTIIFFNGLDSQRNTLRIA